MRLTRLNVRDLRSLREVELSPAPGMNLITGPNGAGKTSLLEAVHLLAYGRSFRGRVRDGVVRTGAEAVQEFAEWEEPTAAGQRQRRAGLRHGGQGWTGRLDGAPVTQLGVLCAALAALTFEPGSHALLSGGGDARRRYLDWGLFHVEQGAAGAAFLQNWRRYGRALKQRNALLKQGPSAAPQLEVWDVELSAAGEPLDRDRRDYVDRLQPFLARRSQDLAPQLGEASFELKAGWRSDQLPLADALLVARDRDLANGFTSVGPHRGDWRILHAVRPAREALSRGQAKLTALAVLLAQAEEFAGRRGHWPVVLLDDLASELDQPHQRRLLSYLRDSGAQVFVTGTDAPVALQGVQEVRTFHVEHGVVL